MCSGAIFTRMLTSKWLIAGLGRRGGARRRLPRCAATARREGGTTPTPSAHALLSSRELWATIDVCNPADQPDTVGIRGSMPGDRHSHDKMYMSFRLQYLNASKQWVDLSSGASSSFVAVGSGASARQGGTSFELKPVAGKPAVTLRGVVDFQWRRGSTVLASGARADRRGAQEPRRRRPAGLQRRDVHHRLNSRGSLVMIPSTPIAVSARSCARRRRSTRRARRRLRRRRGQRARDDAPVRHDRVEAALASAVRARRGSVAR